MTFRKENALTQERNCSEIIKKSILRKIEVSELPDKLPNFRNSLVTKDNVLAEWLKDWIDIRLTQGKLSVNDLLPSKSDIAEKTRVSIGTVQTAIRLIEDEGYVASKQRIGTFICDKDTISDSLRKQTSKREQAINSIKRFIVKQNYKPGDIIPSSRELSKLIGSAPNTTRLAIEYLTKTNVIELKDLKRNKTIWRLKEVPKISAEEMENPYEINSDTLVNKIERELKDLISKNYSVGDKLISHYEISDTFKVSIKTIHDAMKRLVAQGILQSRRGRYGTSIMRIPSDKQVMTGKESEIFAPAAQASLYNYEKVEFYIKNFIKDNHKPGDKLPAMSKFAEELKVSSNTIRKSLQKLEDEGIVRFSRGRYGGTFLIKMSDSKKKEGKSVLSWLAINPEYQTVYSKN